MRVLSLHACNSDSAIDSTPDDDPKALRNSRSAVLHPIRWRRPKASRARQRFSIQSPKAANPQGSEASSTDEPVRIDPVGPRVKRSCHQRPLVRRTANRCRFHHSLTPGQATTQNPRFKSAPKRKVRPPKQVQPSFRRCESGSDSWICGKRLSTFQGPSANIAPAT